MADAGGQAARKAEEGDALKLYIAELEAQMAQLAGSGSGAADDRRKLVRMYNDLLDKYHQAEKVQTRLQMRLSWVQVRFYFQMAMPHNANAPASQVASQAFLQYHRVKSSTDAILRGALLVGAHVVDSRRHNLSCQ